MKALILAAGRGNRLRPYTDAVPKPLLPVGKKRLFDWELAACARAGIRDVVVNTAHLADAFAGIPKEYEKKGFRIVLSREGNSAEEALETLGGIVRALALLTDGKEPFLVLAGDVVHDFDLSQLTAKREAILSGRIDAHLVAVPNPIYHAAGDMDIAEDGAVKPGAGPYTYGCLLIASPRIFTGLKAERSKLFPWLWKHKVTAQVHRGFWGNVGDAAEYAALLKNSAAQELICF